MPAIANSIPITIRQFQWHGLELDWRGDGAKDVYGDCPFCGRSGKISISVETGQFRCFACNSGPENGKVATGGNIYTFFRMLADQAEDAGQATPYQFECLRRERCLLSADSLVSFGLFFSPLLLEWVIPGYSIDGKLMQLYRYMRGPTGKHHLSVTVGTNHQLSGVPLFDPKKEQLFLCEGCWDAMALFEVLRISRFVDADDIESTELELTDDESESIFAFSNVLSVPSCNTFNNAWIPLFAGKDVVLLFDNDHPRETEVGGVKKVQPPAGFEGMKRIATLLLSAAEPPSSIRFLSWGEEGYSSALPTGYDIRDWLTERDSPLDRVKCLESILSWCEPIPKAWTEAAAAVSAGSTSGKVESQSLSPLPCDSFRKMTDQWRKAFRWGEGLDRALSVCMAVVISTETIGEQLWFRILSCPSSGKTTICEALAVAGRFVHSQSELKKLHSGYKADKDGSEDFSLIPKIAGKTLVIKDADPLLKSPDRALILSQLRDLYDGTTRPHYNNGISRVYADIRATMILFGTGAVLELDSAELGARYLDCWIMESIDSDLEREVNRRVLIRALRNVSILSNGKASSRQDGAMVLAKQLTGGYVQHLRTNASRLLSSVSITSDQGETIISFGEFVAFMRARPSKKQDEVTEREFSSRLVEQFTRLTICLAAAINRPEVDELVMSRVRQVAIDTSRGRTLKLVRELFRIGEGGADENMLAHLTGEDVEKEVVFLKFLRRIGAIEFFRHRPIANVLIEGKSRWRLTARLRRLYEEVFGSEK